MGPTARFENDLERSEAVEDLERLEPPAAACTRFGADGCYHACDTSMFREFPRHARVANCLHARSEIEWTKSSAWEIESLTIASTLT